MGYHIEFYNEIRGDEQRIRLGEGCPNNCKYCSAPKELISYDIPEIKRNKVTIMDMNFLYNPKHKQRIKDLGSKKVNNKVVYYELICGLDYRNLDQETANLLKENRFINIRFAWDHKIDEQMKIKDCYNKFLKAGYKKENLMCFIICDWEIPFNECFLKLMLLKNWNICVSDCWYNNVTPPNYQCNYWLLIECKLFRALCALHNQNIKFGIYPDLKRAKRLYKLLDELKNQTKISFA